MVETRSLLVCPVCKGRLEFATPVIRCEACGLRFVQSRENCVNLLPDHLLVNDGNCWGERQREMEQWYRELIAQPARAGMCLVHDYETYAAMLAGYSGLVLDVGGGVGVVRHYLPLDTQYIVIDPSLDWLDADWANLAERFPCLETAPCFIRGVGEYLPFSNDRFDAVLTFWSLNHAHDPHRVLQEAHRVLKRGGRLLVVLEDMEPGWMDLVARKFPTRTLSQTARLCVRKLRCSVGLRQWPLQSDHLRIRDADIRKWSGSHFKVEWRAWMGQYLTYELRKA